MATPLSVSSADIGSQAPYTATTPRSRLGGVLVQSVTPVTKHRDVLTISGRRRS